MSKEKKIILIACAAVLGVAMFAICVLAITGPKTPPAAPVQQIQGEEGIDWEDCINGEPDCFLNRRRIDPTTAKKKTPAPVSTKKPAPVNTRRR